MVILKTINFNHKNHMNHRNHSSKQFALLLDFDGTLADTEPLHALCLREFFASKGYEFSAKDPGKSTFQIFEEWGEQKKNETIFHTYLEEYLAFLPDFFKVFSRKN